MEFFLLSSNIQVMNSDKVQHQHQNMLQKSCQISQDFQRVVNKHPQKGTIHFHRQCLLIKKREKLEKPMKNCLYILTPSWTKFLRTITELEFATYKNASWFEIHAAFIFSSVCTFEIQHHGMRFSIKNRFITSTTLQWGRRTR